MIRVRRVELYTVGHLLWDWDCGTNVCVVFDLDHRDTHSFVLRISVPDSLQHGPAGGTSVFDVTGLTAGTLPAVVESWPEQLRSALLRVCSLAATRLPHGASGQIALAWSALPATKHAADQLVLALATPFVEREPSKVSPGQVHALEPAYWRERWILQAVRTAQLPGSVYAAPCAGATHTRTDSAGDLVTALRVKPAVAPAGATVRGKTHVASATPLAVSAAALVVAAKAGLRLKVPRHLANDFARCYRNALLLLLMDCLLTVKLQECGDFGQQLLQVYRALAVTYDTSAVSICNSHPKLESLLRRIFPAGTPGTYHDPHDLWMAIIDHLATQPGNAIRRMFGFKVRYSRQRTHLLGDRHAVDRAVAELVAKEPAQGIERAEGAAVGSSASHMPALPDAEADILPVVPKDMSLQSEFCNCGSPLASYSSETSYSLAVTLPAAAAKQRTALNELIGAEFEPEEVDARAAIQCIGSGCNKYYLGRFKHVPEEAPSALVIQLKRFAHHSAGVGFNGSPVVISQALQLTVVNDRGEASVHPYIFSALTLYRPGHHATFRKIPGTNNFALFDELSKPAVTLVPGDTEDVPEMAGPYNVYKQAYLLVYKKQELSAAGGAGCAEAAGTGPSSSLSSASLLVDDDDVPASGHAASSALVSAPRLSYKGRGPAPLTAPLIRLAAPDSPSEDISMLPGAITPREAGDGEDVTDPSVLEIADEDDDVTDRLILVKVPALAPPPMPPTLTLRLRPAREDSLKRKWHIDWLSASHDAAFLTPVMYGALRLWHPAIKYVSETLGINEFAACATYLRKRASEQGFLVEEMTFVDSDGLRPTVRSLQTFFGRNDSAVESSDTGFGVFSSHHPWLDDAVPHVLSAARSIREGLCRLYSVPNRCAAPFYAKDESSDIPGCAFKLAPDALRAVHGWLHPPPTLPAGTTDLILACGFLETVKWRDLLCLRETAWLSGQVLSLRTDMLNAEHELLLDSCGAAEGVILQDDGVSGLDSCFCLPSDFHWLLCGKTLGVYSYLDAAAYAKHVGLHPGVRPRRFILIPLNYRNIHWYLAVLDTRDRILYILNSYPSIAFPIDSDEVRNIIVWYTEFVAECSESSPEDLRLWRVINCAVEKQHNDYDCGMFTINFMRCIVSGKRFDFKQADIPALRIRLAEDLLRKASRLPAAPS